MRNWNLLSDEILNNIFVNLKTEDMYLPRYLHVAQCALTCRDWRIAAQSIVFSNIRLDSIKQMNEIQRLVSSNKMIGNWVKRLNISFVVDNINALLTIDSLLPKLEELSFGRSLPLVYACFGKMLTERNRFRNLKSIPCPSIGQQDSIYLQCLDHIKNRATCIVLWEDDYHGRDSYLALRYKLHQFRSLETIVLNTFNKINPQSVSDYLDSLVNRSSASLNQIDMRVRESDRLFFSPTMQNTIQPTDSLRRLFLEISSSRYVFIPPDDQFLVYLIKKFPKLSNFCFCFSIVEYEDTNLSPDYFPVQSVDAIQQFLVYLCNIPVCIIQSVIISNENTSKIIHYLYTAAVDATSLPVSSHCLLIRYRASMIGSFQDRNSIKAYIDFHLLKYLGTRTIKVVFYRKDTTCYKQQFELIEEVGNFFDTMCLLATTNTGFAFILNHVARYCPNITNLAISKEALSFDPFENQENVLVEGIGVTRLIIKDLAPSLEQFPHMSLCFPHLKALTLYGYFEQFTKNEGFFFSISMPNSSFTTFRVVMSQENMSSLNPIFIKVTTEVSEPRYCYFVPLMLNPSERYIPQYSDDKYEPTEIGYKNSILDKGVTTCHIHCKSVEKFTVELEKSPLGFILESKVLISI